MQQPENFRFCPLGVQLYSPRQLPEFEDVEFTICLPGSGNGSAEQIPCAGVVVQCSHDRRTKLYRVWVKFLGLSPARQERIRCLASSSGFLCPYCENYS